MTAIEILDRFKELGVEVELVGDLVQATPVSKVPSDLLAEAKAHKQELINELTPIYGYDQMPPLDRPRSFDAAAVLSRLVDGSHWLSQQHGLWLDDDDAAVDDSAFYHALAGWETLESKLRSWNSFQGFIFGPGEYCPQEAVVNCAACD